MAHPKQRQFLQSVVDSHPEFFSGGKIIEIGSLNINGTVRDFFVQPDEYFGVDLSPGPCVDLVEEGQNVDFPNEYFDVAISAECFEHNPQWEATFVNMIRMTRSGGLVVFTCATEGRKEHGTTRSEPETSPFTVEKGWDYYRNLTADDFAHLGIDDLFVTYEFSVQSEVHDLYFYGLKR